MLMNWSEASWWSGIREPNRAGLGENSILVSIGSGLPELRKVKVLRRDGSVTELREDDKLSGDDVIPGFRCPLREILPKRLAADNGPQPPSEPNGD